MRSRGTATARGLSARVAATVVVVGAAVVVGASGCSGGDPAPTPSWTYPTVTRTPSPTPTPTPTPTDPAAVPPERPEAMGTVDTTGAEAVAVYYLQLVPYAEATGDVSVLAALSHSDCIFCTSVLDGIAELTAAGHHNTGGLPNVSEVSALEVDPGKWWTVDLELTQEPSQTLDAAGNLVREAADTVTYHMDVAVVHEGDLWQVRELSYEVTRRVAP